MRFTKRTYRKARARSIQRIMNAAEWFKQTQHPSYGDNVRYEAVTAYDAALREGMAIVARARREKGMYRA